MKKIYLAGDFGIWRKMTIETLKDGYEICNPLEASDYPLYYVRDNLKAVEQCDILFVFRPKKIIDCFEMGLWAGIAYRKSITIIFADETDFPDPSIFSIAKRTFTKLETAACYLRFWAEGGDEIKALHKAIEPEKQK
ncbi:MAG: hypothetical protein PHE59_01605 [Patescibacteria group bacterium]|nr:hypothetical protein [Patescibacteria group bacterium]MDD5164496.1 hypothetical protein [Patescibacteria group bacterium]MDD5534146.1 hypothetical protein [Patescibacteria group bacterium]